MEVDYWGEEDGGLKWKSLPYDQMSKEEDYAWCLQLLSRSCVSSTFFDVDLDISYNNFHLREGIEIPYAVYIAIHLLSFIEI